MTDAASESPDFSNQALFTPAMRQFIEVKNRYPNTLVLFRMGDFYETFFKDAVIANRLIGITLTKRGKLTDGTPIPMAGISAVSLDTYIARLVRQGESVVIVEQKGNTPGAKGMIEREVSRIVTPGTLTDTSLLPEKSDSILLAASFPKKKTAPIGLVWLTLSNGDFRAEEVTPDSFEAALARIRPSELLVDEDMKREMRTAHPEIAVSTLPDWHFDAKRGASNLCATFGMTALDAWDVTNRTTVLAAANALLDYIRETQVDLVPFIEPLKLVEESQFIVLDPSTRRNLEVDESLSANGEGPTLFSVMDHCATAMGSREMRRWLREPLRSMEDTSARHDAVEAIMGDEPSREHFFAVLDALPDVERIASRVSLGTVRPRELASLRDTLPTLSALGASLADSPLDLIAGIGRSMTLNSEIWERLEQSLVPEPPGMLRDGDTIASSCSPELAELRHFRDDTSRILLEMEERERAATGINTLRVQYNKVSGFYIEVTKGAADQVPMHYQRRQTLKNCERFITPELKSIEDRALSSKERSAALEKELYDKLVAETAKHTPELLAAAKAAAQLDVLCAFARHAAENRWHRPKLSSRPGLDIRKGRHPVVETAIENYVPNDCRLEDGRRMLIVTGPNMGGKSTYMRSVALIVLLTWAGSFVPAAAAEIGPIDRMHTRIGASDDLAHGRSTFMVEMTEAAFILSHATDRSLVLMDEIGRGTSTFDGLSLAAAIAQELVQKTRSFTLFATHYFELTRLAQELREVANVHVAAAQGSAGIVFKHEIKEGPASKSYGIAVAQLAGVPAPVVRRARGFLAKLEAQANAQTSNLPDLFAEPMLPAEDDAWEPDPLDAPLQSEPSPADLARKSLTHDLMQADVDNMTPKAAMELLYAFRERAAGIESLEKSE